MKKSLLLQKDLLEPLKIKSKNIWLQNVYFNKLADIVDINNNTYDGTIKISLLILIWVQVLNLILAEMIIWVQILNLILTEMIKMLNSKFVMMLEYQNIKHF